jgi:hypothetical protein
MLTAARRAVAVGRRRGRVLGLGAAGAEQERREKERERAHRGSLSPSRSDDRASMFCVGGLENAHHARMESLLVGYR